jgi:hypothetical protein
MAVCAWASVEELVSVVKTTVRVRTANKLTAIQARHTKHAVARSGNIIRT